MCVKNGLVFIRAYNLSAGKAEYLASRVTKHAVFINSALNLATVCRRDFAVGSKRADKVAVGAVKLIAARGNKTYNRVRAVSYHTESVNGADRSGTWTDNAAVLGYLSYGLAVKVGNIAASKRISRFCGNKADDPACGRMNNSALVYFAEQNAFRVVNRAVLVNRANQGTARIIGFFTHKAVYGRGRDKTYERAGSAGNAVNAYFTQDSACLIKDFAVRVHGTYDFTLQIKYLHIGKSVLGIGGNKAGGFARSIFYYALVRDGAELGADSVIHGAVGAYKSCYLSG